MSKFCTNCGEKQNKDARFCTVCGAGLPPIVKEISSEKESSGTTKKPFISKRNEGLSHTANIAEKGLDSAGKTAFSKMRASSVKGELVLPMELNVLPKGLVNETPLTVLLGGLKDLAGNLKNTLKNRRLQIMVLVLVLLWLFINFMLAAGNFSLPVRLLSWLTAAQGSLIGGSIGKGLLAAFLAQIIVNPKTLQGLKGGIGQLTAVIKGGKESYAPLMLGMGTALIVSNLMISSSLQNSMVPIAAFALSIKALNGNGYLRRFVQALPLKSGTANTTFIMQGWALGFALFVPVSFVTGGKNGFILGIPLIIAGIILAITAKKNQEVPVA